MGPLLNISKERSPTTTALTFSLRKQFSNWISGHLNYTWSHNIDETSNGGLFQYGFEGNNTILGQIYPDELEN